MIFSVNEFKIKNIIFQPLASKFGTTFRALNYKKIKPHTGVVPVRIQRQFYSPYGELYCFAVLLCFAQCYSLREFVANKITLNPNDSITLLSGDNNITLPQGRITLEKLFRFLYNSYRGGIYGG